MIDIFIHPAYAQCPVCVVTVGGGLFIAKKLGIDDLLVSIWLSGLNTAIAFWFASSMKRKMLSSGWLWSFALFVFTLIYLMATKQTGHRGNTFLGVDKIVFGMTLGFIVSLGAVFIDKWVRYKNNGKVRFYYQKVIIPLVFFLVTSGIFSLLIGIITK
ncbi:hypothetical protein COY90_00110 [Candidatus Roizmanbacteria bacterium CG_4_10_14_0_8_um_filter_39_9]|uniref:Uncharacterized protein n=1 Tax=Candidatus Roizmanbacteria bacterium CG_4_10_14_0_8_um_filter_39_9 TaxID=1974829 RepID=A0A2M7QE98_9BACT|nr:MAG: hypothetical protein COY90_00110 [Candidatus Roizmanbacteria bacterium CG_4_10_14_0_8_um_filter_39_9]